MIQGQRMQVRHLTKQEYIQAKNIPNSNPTRKIQAEPSARQHLSTPQQMPPKQDEQQSNYNASKPTMHSSASQPMIVSSYSYNNHHQVEGLISRISHLEEECKTLRQNNLNLNGTLNQIQNQCKELENKNMFQENQVRMIEQEKKQFEDALVNARNEMDNFSNFQANINYLQEENNRLKNENLSQQQEFQQKVHILGEQLANQEQERNQQNDALYQDTINSQEEKIVLLTQELERLNLINEKLQKNEWKEKFDQLQQDYRAEMDLIKQRDEQQKKSLLTYEESYQKNSREKQEMEFQTKQLTSKNQELEQQLQYYGSEINKIHTRNKELEDKQNKSLENDKTSEQLQITIGDKNREIDYLKEKLKIIEKSSMESLEELKGHYEMMRKSLVMREIQELNIKFNTERTSLQNHIKTLTQKNEEHMQTQQILISDKDRMQNLLDQKQSEGEEFRTLNMNFETQIKKYKNENENYRNNYQQLELECQQKMDDIHSLFIREKNMELEKKEGEIREECEKELQRLKSIYEANFLQKYVLVMAELERIVSLHDEKHLLVENQKHVLLEQEQIKNELAEQHEKEIKHLTQKQIMETENNSKTQISQCEKIQYLDNKAGLLITENERLNSIAAQKISEMSQIQQGHEDYKNSVTLEISEMRSKYEEYKSKKTQELDQIIDKIQFEKEELEKQVQVHQEQKQQDDQRLNYLSFEIERQQKLVFEKDNELTGLKNQKGQIEEQNNHYSQQVELMNGEFIMYKQETTQHFNEITIKINAEKTQLEQKIISLNYQIEEKNLEINSLKNDNDKLNSNAHDRQSQLEVLKSSQMCKPDDVDYMKSQLDNYKKKYQEADEKHIRLQKEKNQTNVQLSSTEQQLIAKTEENESLFNYLEERKNDDKLQSMEISNLKKELAQLQERYQQLEAEKQLREEKHDQVNRENDELKNHKDHYKKQIEKMKIDFNQQEQQIQTHVKDLQTFQKSYEVQDSAQMRNFNAHSRGPSPFEQPLKQQNICIPLQSHSSNEQNQQFSTIDNHIHQSKEINIVSSLNNNLLQGNQGQRGDIQTQYTGFEHSSNSIGLRKQFSKDNLMIGSPTIGGSLQMNTDKLQTRIPDNQMQSMNAIIENKQEQFQS